MPLQWVMLPISKIEFHTSKPIHKDYPSSLTTLAEHLKAKRMDLRLSKSSFAKLLRINPMTISLWENSDRKPAPRMMKKIIAFLGYIPPLGIKENTLAYELYKYRCINGVTQKDIALQLKIDRSAVTKIENNTHIEIQYIRKIETFLNSQNSLVSKT